MRANNYSLIQISISTALPDNHQSGSQLLMCEGLSEPSVFCSTPLLGFGTVTALIFQCAKLLKHLGWQEKCMAYFASSFLGFKSSGFVLF